jgi:hypothetical protein
MPIRFRCGYCDRLLGIARRKAGSETTCPHCGYTLTVPDEEYGDSSEMEDLDELLNPQSPPPSPEIDSRLRSKSVTNSKIHSTIPETSRSSSSAPATSSTDEPSKTRPSKVPATASATTTSAATATHPSGERPLLERDIDQVLGTSPTAETQETAKSKPTSTSGTNALSVGAERGQIVLSVQKATLLAVLGVILIGVSFAAGFLLASAK